MTSARVVLAAGLLLATVVGCVAPRGCDGSCAVERVADAADAATDATDATDAADATRHRSAPGALGPYSGSVQAGELLFLSGKIGERDGSFEHEARTAIAAVLAEAARAGAGPADLLSCTVYLTDMARYAEFNAVYAELLPAPHPARACVAVAALPAGARVEIQAVARVPRAAEGEPAP